MADYFDTLRSRIDMFVSVRRTKIDQYNDFRQEHKNKVIRLEGPVDMYRTFEKAVALFNLNTSKVIFELQFNENDDLENSQYDLLWR